MRVLVNYSQSEQRFLSSLAYILKAKGIQALSTNKILSVGELVSLCRDNNCEAIIIANEETLQSCVPGKKPTLDKYRGSVLRFSVPAIVINSLEHFHSVPYGDWLMAKDIDKLFHLKEPMPEFHYRVLHKTELFEPAYAVMKSALLMTYDVETATLNEPEEDSGNVEAGESIITCCAWTCLMPSGELQTFVLPFVSFCIDHWQTDRDYGKAINLLRKVNALPIRKAMHNGPYDCTHSLRYRAAPMNYTLDTMALAHAEFSELPKDLAFVASYHLPYYIYWKDDAELASKEKDINKYWAYNAKDTWHTMLILISQLRTIQSYAKTNFNNLFKMVYPSLYCGFEGFKIDNNVRLELRAQAVDDLEKHRGLLRTYFADPNFNPGSWQQVQKYIYNVFGAVKPKIGKSKSGTDEPNLKAVAEQHPLLALLTHSILEYRGAQKAIGTYYDFLQINERLLWALNPFGTETERMACNASSLWCGTQVQNIPSYAKAMLVADEGYEIVEADEKQAEARCTAYCSQELGLIKALEDPDKDFYKVLGFLFFKIPYEEVTDFFRNKVLKKIQHGTNYMMGARTFIDNIGTHILHETATLLGFKLVPKPHKNRQEEKTIHGFAGEILDVYHKPFPRIRIWYKEIFNEISTTGFLKSPLGQVRKFFGNISKDHKILRSGVAHQPQNLSVSILNMGLWKVYKNIVIPSKGEFRLKAQIHDSILAQYRADKRDYYLKLMAECMDNPVVVHGRTLRIPVDFKVGKIWSKCKDPSKLPKE